MAVSATNDPIEQSTNDEDSDYGSDFSPEEEQIVERWLSGQQIDIEDNPIVNEAEHDDSHRTLRVPRVFGREQRSPLFQAARMAEKVAEQISNSVHGEYYPDLSNQVKKPSTDLESPSEPAPGHPKGTDARSPLERFRTQPRKALSVTDLVSPAWCELQYWYILTLHGRKRRTPAMKQGSIVHKQLEEQVHTTVQVDIQTKEDAWGLRIWNVIQGLRTLRNEGQTRELEIWGIIDGLVVNGVIDELSYICPDKDLEESPLKPSAKDDPPPDQPTISDFFKAIGGTSLEATRIKRPYRTNKIYVCDVKTRSVRSLPAEVAFRPTKMQLMLYHRILSSLATNSVDFSILTSRYNLDPCTTFSDSFIAQVGSLNDEIFYNAQSSPEASQDSTTHWGQDSMTTLLAHNNLSAFGHL